MPGWGEIFAAVRDIGFPAVIALLLFWLVRSMITVLNNDFRHSLEDIAGELREGRREVTGALGEVREVMAAVLEHLRTPPPTPPGLHP